MLILWSGGIDSTVVLCDALNYHYNNVPYEYRLGLDYGKFEFSKDHGEPRALTIENDQLPQIQQRMQRLAMQNIKKATKKKGHDFDHGILKIHTTLTSNMYGIGYQCSLWLIQAAMFVRDGEPLLVGWIKGDSATMQWHRMQIAWEYLTLAIDKKSTLCAPYMWYNKESMIEKIKNHRMLTKCWYCDNPSGKNPCGKCLSCLSMVGARAILKAKQKN